MTAVVAVVAYCCGRADSDAVVAAVAAARDGQVILGVAAESAAESAAGDALGLAASAADAEVLAVDDVDAAAADVNDEGAMKAGSTAERMGLCFVDMMGRTSPALVEVVGSGGGGTLDSAVADEMAVVADQTLFVGAPVEGKAGVLARAEVLRNMQQAPWAGGEASSRETLEAQSEKVKDAPSADLASQVHDYY